MSTGQTNSEELQVAPNLPADVIEQAPAPDVDDIDALMGKTYPDDVTIADEPQMERQSRHQETHDAEDMHEGYTEFDDDLPEVLDAPTCRPGMTQRWVSTVAAGVADVRNMARKANEGWKPRRASTVPKGFHVPTMDHGQFKGTIGVEGMVLMERPLELHRRYAAKNAQKTTDLNMSVEQNLMTVHQPGAVLGKPTMNGQSRVARGRPDPASD